MARALGASVILIVRSTNGTRSVDPRCACKEQGEARAALHIRAMIAYALMPTVCLHDSVKLE